MEQQRLVSIIVLVSSSSYYSQLSAVFPEWTVDHQGKGLATILSIQPAIGEKDRLQRLSKRHKYKLQRCCSWKKRLTVLIATTLLKS